MPRSEREPGRIESPTGRRRSSGSVQQRSIRRARIRLALPSVRGARRVELSSVRGKRDIAPVLHQMYSFDDAITSFGNETLPEFFCQDNFIVLPKAVFCLATLGDAALEPHLQSPSCVIWKRPDCRTWLPGKVTEVW